MATVDTAQSAPTMQDASTALMIIPDPTGLPVKVGEAYSRAMLEIEHLLDSPEVLRRFAHVLLTEIRTKPDLQACSPDSLITAIVEMAEENLDPSGMNECFLVPYKGKVTMQRGYAGLIKLACSHPEVLDVFADEVCVNDTYEFYGVSARPKHVYPGSFQPRGRYIGYYAVAQLTHHRWRAVQMSVEEIKAHAKQYSLNAGNKVWSEDPGGGFRGMSLKTVLRKLCNPKYIPMAARVYEKLHQQAIVEGLIVDSTAVEEREPLALREPEKTAEAHIRDLCGDQAALDASLTAARAGAPPPTDYRLFPATQEGQIERLLIAQGLTQEQRDTYWEGLRAKHTDLSPGLLTSIHENLQAGTTPLATLNAVGNLPTDTDHPDDPTPVRRTLAAVQERLGWTAQQKKAWENKQARRFRKTYSEFPAETLRELIAELEGQRQTATENASPALQDAPDSTHESGTGFPMEGTTDEPGGSPDTMLVRGEINTERGELFENPWAYLGHDM